MFKHLVKITSQLSCLNTAASYKYIRHGCMLPISRPFSSEMTADWPESIKTFLENEKITEPTKIQEKTLPLAMSNRDLVGVARTGSGKTLAFVIPAIMKILKERELDPDFDSKKQRLATCLVLAPTRELASQTYDVLKKFNRIGIRSIVLVGGASRSEQANHLQYKDHDVYIGTPGRLKDLYDSRLLDLSNIKYLVLDEADRMLDMGFEPQIKYLVDLLPEDRQTLMFSATWPTEIQSLAENYMKDYEQVAVDSEKLKANPNIKQIIEVCEPYYKMDLLIKKLEQIDHENNQARKLIFVNTKRMADSLFKQLMRNRRKAVSMHGDRSQQQRDRALQLFKSKECDILVATDVAARGLDINDITHVINYDTPKSVEDYIHRIGRTARHDKSGTSLTFFTDEDSHIARKLIRVLNETNQEIPEKLVELAQEGRKLSDKPIRYEGYSRYRNDYQGRQQYGYRNYGRRGYDQQSFDQQPSRFRSNLYDADDDQDDNRRPFKNYE